LGDSKLNKSLTIVLPVHNAESQLQKSVTELLEMASELTPKFGVLIIDDGSTDATFEVAEELAAHYPQVSIQRYRHRRGLGAAIEYAQRRVKSDAVMVHDGVTPMDTQQMRTTWKNWVAQTTAGASNSVDSHSRPHDICDFANLPAIHALMEQAHRRVLGFQMISCERLVEESPEGLSQARCSSARIDSPPDCDRTGVGRIPLLPRPKFLSAVAAFALGE